MPACPYPLDRLLVYRIEHYENLPYILRHGMHTRNHPSTNPNHIFIGNVGLTNDRHTHVVRPIDHPTPEAFGTLGDYVPFYFGPRSPMLLNISTGFRGVPQRPQRDIVYLGCRAQTLMAACDRFAFTDGHGYDRFTTAYANPENLSQLEWDYIYARQWTSTEEHPGRFRCKQAEFLVHSVVAPEWITGLVVFDEERRTFAQEQLRQVSREMPVVVNPGDNQGPGAFYYL